MRIYSIILIFHGLSIFGQNLDIVTDSSLGIVLYNTNDTNFLVRDLDIRQNLETDSSDKIVFMEVTYIDTNTLLIKYKNYTKNLTSDGWTLEVCTTYGDSTLCKLESADYILNADFKFTLTNKCYSSYSFKESQFSHDIKVYYLYINHKWIQILSPDKSAEKIVEHIRSNFQLRGKTEDPPKPEK